MLAVGKKVPFFTLNNHNGEIFDLKNYIGMKNLVIFFYPKSNTYGCTKEACAFRDHYENFSDAGALVIGISSDLVSVQKDFANKHKLPFILLSDPDQKVRNLFHVKKSLGILPGRATFVVDKKGQIVHQFVSQLQFEKHVEESLQIIKDLKDEEYVG